MKKILTLLLTINVLGCSSPSNVTPNKLSLENNGYVTQLSQNKGANLSVKINFDSSFKVKASANGTSAKQPTDIAKVDVYLLKLPAGFTGTDPLGTANANIVTSFANVPKTGSTFSMTFKNVPGLANPNQYYVGVVVKDSANNVIGKSPVIDWTGQTMTLASSLALSTSGTGVDQTTLAVSSANDLVVNVPLLDAASAQIGSTVNVTPGNSNLPNTNITVQ